MEYIDIMKNLDIMKNFVIQGRFRIRTKWQKFAKTVTSNNEKNAIEKTYSTIGSQHRLKRNYIKIDNVKEVTQ